LSNCLNSGVTDIAILTDYQRSTMAGYLRRWYDGNTRPNSFHLSDNWPIRTEEGNLVSEEYSPGSIINSLVSPGCVIKDRLTAS
jgi:ADP-glucose pyrophosphorylase